MNEVIIFYSWQSDINAKFNRSFIGECLKIAIEKTNKNVEILYSLDRDTKNIGGTPDIAATIFDKIDQCQLFIADVTIINSQSSESRKAPNPNVLIELGYAASKIGWNNVICVFNSKFGTLNDLPFDIRSRRILQYELNEGSEKKTEKDKLIEVFKSVIGKIDLDEIHRQFKIDKRFVDEPDYIRKIALHKGKYWEFELLGKLLENRFSNIETELDKIKKGYVFGKKQKITHREFLDLLKESLERIRVVIAKMTNALNYDMKEALGEQGYPGDAIKIKNLADVLYQIFNELVEIEKDLNKVNIPRKMMELKSAMDGWAKELIEQVYILPEEFRKIYSGYYKAGDTVSVDVAFKLPKSTEQMINMLEEFSINPYLAMEDDD